MSVRNNARESRFRRASAAGALATVMALAACDSLLDVENPNELVDEQLESPTIAASLANGALATVARAYSYMLLLHGTASDELQFVGSRDAWIQLQRGDLRDPANEFSDEAYPFVNEGRWTADEAIRRLKEFDAAGELEDRGHLASAQLYSAMIYTQIADLWEDFTISDRRESGPPLGDEGMLGMYDQAIQNLDEALPIAQEIEDRELETAILAQRARTKHAKAVRSLITPAGSAPASALVADPGSIEDAEAALARAPSTDWKFRFEYAVETVDNNWGAWVNNRLELRVSDAYVEATDDDKKVDSITLMDPIDDVAAPHLAEIVDGATNEEVREFGPITAVSTREMRLILAEAALANGDEAGFAEHINPLRALDDLTSYSDQMDAEDLLEHSRMTNLYLTGRRLIDHYRFGTQSFLWSPNQEAAQRPGTLFPITLVEQRANCHIVDPSSCPS